MAKGSCHLFLGPELGEKNDAIAAVRRKIAEEAGEKPEETSFYAGEDEVSTILSVALNGSLFAAARLLLVKNAELLKKKDEVNAIADYIKAPGEDTTLIFVSEQTKIDIEKCFEGALKSNKKIFWELFEEQKKRYIEDFFKKNGFKVERDAVDALLELVENNTNALREECLRIMSFLKQSGAGTVVSSERIETFLSHSKQETVFSLFSALSRGDFAKTLTVAHALVDAQTAPQAIFGFLATAFRKFRDYCEISREGRESDFELKKAGINALGKKDYVSARRIYGDDAPDIFLSLTAEYDVACRSNSALSAVMLDMFLYRIFSFRRE